MSGLMVAAEVEGKDIGRVDPFRSVLFLYEGFWELSPDRSFGMGAVSGIPYTSKDKWINNNVDYSWHKIAYRMIGAMDAEFLAWNGRETKKASKKK